MPDPTPPMIRPVLLAGGSGTRLWPVSRASMPKQFATLLGDESLFQSTVRRVTGPGFAPPIIVTAEPFRFIALEQLDAIGAEIAALLIEPEPRNTAPATASAVAWAERYDPDSLILVTPTDHAIDEAEAFRDTVRGAAGTAGIVTFGVAPDRAETGYGWLECKDGVTDLASPGPLLRFVEKPDSATAHAFLDGGRHLWNAGLFLAPSSAWVAAFEAHAPETWAGAQAAVQGARADLGFLRLARDAYMGLPAVSLDVAIMEKAAGLSVMPLRLGWSDLGAWDAVARAATTPSANVTAIDCDDSYLHASDSVRLVGIGLKDMLAVAVGDAVLVAPKDRAQDVRLAVETMARAGIAEATRHPVDHRPWGWFETLVLGDRFRVKRIVVKPGGRLSLQSHRRRAEHWVVVEGTAQVTIGETRRRLGENQSIYVPVGARHRLENETSTNVVLIEIQTGAYLGEDDIERYDDAYARARD